MANEAQLRVRTAEPLPFTVADATGIEKGALLALQDPRTASGAAAVTIGVMMAGIAAREKVANDGRTELAVFRQGWFDMVVSGATAVGQKVVAAGHDNMVRVYEGVLVSGAAIIGTLLETASAGETCLVDVNIGVGG